MKLKWLKLAGYSLFIFFIVEILYLLLRLQSANIPNPILSIVSFILTIFFCFGLISLGRYNKNKNLELFTWIYFYFMIFIEIFFIISLFITGFKEFLVQYIGLSINLNTVIVNYLPLSFEGILMILIGISLFEIKNIKFIRINSILTIIYGLILFILNLFVLPIILYNSSIYDLFIMNPVSYIISIVISVGILIGLVIYYILMSIMFFNASKKFESNLSKK